MTTPLDLEIRTRISAVLRGETSLRDFYFWFAPVSVQIGREDDPDALHLIYALAHLFAELDDSVVTAAEVKRELRRLVSTHTVTATPWNKPRGPVVKTADFNAITEAPAMRIVLARPRAVASA